MARNYVYQITSPYGTSAIKAITKSRATTLRAYGNKVVNLSYGYRSNAPTVSMAKLKQKRRAGEWY